MINLKRKDQLKTKEDVPVAEAFELYMLKNFYNIKLNPLTSKMLHFWEKDFDQSITKHIKFLKKILKIKVFIAPNFLKFYKKWIFFKLKITKKQRRKPR